MQSSHESLCFLGKAALNVSFILLLELHHFQTKNKVRTLFFPPSLQMFDSEPFPNDTVADTKCGHPQPQHDSIHGKRHPAETSRGCYEMHGMQLRCVCCCKRRSSDRFLRLLAHFCSSISRLTSAT